MASFLFKDPKEGYVYEKEDKDINNLHMFYEDYMANKKDLNKLLNLLVIESLTQGGIKDYNTIKKNIINIYGFQNIILLKNLEKLGWLEDKKIIIGKSLHRKIVEDLDLLNWNPKIVDNCTFVYNGLCPISLRLFENALEGNWNQKKVNNILKQIPGSLEIPFSEEEIKKPKDTINTIFFVMIGGITYAEIEGIRFLNRKLSQMYENKTSPKIQIIIITTSIINNKKIFNDLGKTCQKDYTMKLFREQYEKEEKDKKNKK